MSRILADLPEDDIKWLDARAAEQGKSRAAMLREAVSVFRAEGDASGLGRGFGLWKKHGFNEDGLAFERRHRSGARE